MNEDILSQIKASVLIFEKVEELLERVPECDPNEELCEEPYLIED